VESKTELPRKPAPTARNGDATKCKPAKARPRPAATGKLELSTKDRAKLASEIINTALQSLSAVLKGETQPQPATVNPVAVTKRSTLRRSNSAPLTPLQPRCLNRQSTSPIVARKQTANPVQTAPISTACLPTIESARIALRTMSELDDSEAVRLPSLQLETAISSFISKLISLKLHDQALKEISWLKQRLEDGSASDAKVPARKAGTRGKLSDCKTISDLLDFKHSINSPSRIPLVIATQMQVLRILAHERKLNQAEAALTHLDLRSKTSPVNLILSAARLSNADVGKLSKHLQTFSQLLLSLSPQVGSSADTIALDPRLSISPRSALSLQCNGLVARLHSQRMSDDAGSVENDVYAPLSRSIAAYLRRDKSRDPALYQACVNVLRKSFDKSEDGRAVVIKKESSSYADVLRMLASFAKECGLVQEAIDWTTQLLELSKDGRRFSKAREAGITAQLVSLRLREDMLTSSTIDLLRQLREAMSGSLAGDTAELDELLRSIVSARKAAMFRLLDRDTPTCAAATEQLEKLIIQCPRFYLRWLGKPPAPQSSTKDFLRYEQRRQLAVQSVPETLDSTLMTIRNQMQNEQACWDEVEPVLRDALTLLSYLGDIGLGAMASSSYHVKISSFFSAQFDAMIAVDPCAKEPSTLKPLRQAIDCIKDRPPKERKQGRLLGKLDRLAGLYRASGRRVDAHGTLQLLRATLVENGTLASIAAAMAGQHPAVAWTVTEDAKLLGRTLSAISAMEPVYIDWTTDLAELERAAVLERRIRNLDYTNNSVEGAFALSHHSVQELLGIYSPVRFPIRRLGILLHLLSRALGSPDYFEELQVVTADAARSIGHTEFGEDRGLLGYVSHLQAYHESLSALGAPGEGVRSVEGAIDAWSTILGSSTTEQDLTASVGDLDELQGHLTSVADQLEMRGSGPLTETLELAAKIAELTKDSRPGIMVDKHIALASHYVDLGWSVKAQVVLGQLQAALNDTSRLAAESTARLHLFLAEHDIRGGHGRASALEHLQGARAAVEKSRSRFRSDSFNILFARACSVHAAISRQTGGAHHALGQLRFATTMLLQSWPKSNADSEESPMRDGSAETGNHDMTASSAAMPMASFLAPGLYQTFSWLLNALFALSELYCFYGMYRETMYYAEQAYKLAQPTGSKFHIARAAAWLGQVLNKAAQSDKAMPYWERAARYVAADMEVLRHPAVAVKIGRYLMESPHQGQMTLALSKLQGLHQKSGMLPGSQTSDGLDMKVGQLEDCISSLSIEAKATGSARKPKTKPVGARGTKARSATKNKTLVPATVAACEQSVYTPSDIERALLAYSAQASLHEGDWHGTIKAMIRLSSGQPAAQTPGRVLKGRSVLVSALLGMIREQMGQDSVFSVIHDSTISYPAIANPHVDKLAQERLSLSVSSPVPRSNAVIETPLLLPHSEQFITAGFVDNLRYAQSCLSEGLSFDTLAADSSSLHEASGLMQSAGLLLVSTASTRDRIHGVQAHPAYSTEWTRNVIWLREGKAAQFEYACMPKDGLSWPELPASVSGRKSSTAVTNELGRFQRDYIDIIPDSWNVISISLTDDKHDLCITKMHAHQSPFVLRLPLGRANSRDADNEIFDFQQGVREMRDIVQLCNEQCHDARDMSEKGARSAWWGEREALDERLKDLLDNIQAVWLGGFRGVFSIHQKRSDLLARFQKTFHNVLDKHLPSRRHPRGRRPKAAAAVTKLTLDPRILDLFIGLGDASQDGCDFDDVLTDLLYFVVDILQFNGERNAYDEIDFDAMAVETFDALHAYHSAANRSGAGSAVEHTVLILDKALHGIPWEALPCMADQPISRVPSLACLRRLILEQQSLGIAQADRESSTFSREVSGHHADLRRTTCILNPGGDLSSTQKTFQSTLTTHPEWTHITSREPSENEFETALASSDLLLYFGHGSGAQYIRSKVVRRLPKCRATAFLMGCSSAALPDAGQFETYGTVWNYLLAGCPAVVGTLWDVTDRDIDRFAGRCFEEWGVVERGAFAEEGTRANGKPRRKPSNGTGTNPGSNGMRGRDHAAAEPVQSTVDNAGESSVGDETPASLAVAVMRARAACKFRYLTAAAVCVYGIPVYLHR
jgi:separase